MNRKTVEKEETPQALVTSDVKSEDIIYFSSRDEIDEKQGRKPIDRFPFYADTRVLPMA